LLVFIILSVALLIVLFPYFWTLLSSFKDAAAINHPLDFNFKPTLDNWEAVIKSDIIRCLLNSIIVGVVVVLISLAAGSYAAYSFSHFNVGGSSAKFLVLLAQMLPPATLVIPLFLIMYKLKMIGTLFPVIIAHLTILPLVTWFMIGFFDEVPKELEEQAMVDGCTEGQAFIKVIIPAVLPGLGAAGLFGFILSWNDLFYALLLTTGKCNTLPVAVAGYWTFRGVEMGQMSAAIILAIIPGTIFTLFIQRFLLRGMTGGAIKG